MLESNVIYIGKWKRKKLFKKTLLFLDMVFANWTFYAVAFLGISFIFFVLGLSMLMVFPLWISKVIFPEKVDQQVRPVIRLVQSIEKPL